MREQKKGEREKEAVREQKKGERNREWEREASSSFLSAIFILISHLTYLDIRCIEISGCLSPTHSDCESTKFSASCCRCGISDCLKHSLYIRESSDDGIENEKEEEKEKVRGA